MDDSPVPEAHLHGNGLAGPRPQLVRAAAEISMADGRWGSGRCADFLGSHPVLEWKRPPTSTTAVGAERQNEQNRGEPETLPREAGASGLSRVRECALAQAPIASAMAVARSRCPAGDGWMLQ